MGTPDPNYRTNHERTVYVVGEFNVDLLKIAIPRITQLRYQSKDPISVVINSTGGDSDCLDALIAALSVTDPDGIESRVITSVVGEAASAGAILLTLGDYALATPASVIHFHGIRLSEYEVTTESAAQLANRLFRENQSIAHDMAKAMMPRIIHRFIRLKTDVRKYKRKEPRLAAAVAFVELAMDRTVTSRAHKIYSDSASRLIRVRNIIQSARRVKYSKGESPLKRDAKLLKHIIDFEMKDKDDPLDRIQEEGVRRIVSDYLMIRDFTFGDHMFFLDTLIRSCGPEFLDSQQLAKFKGLKATSETKAYAFLVDQTYFCVQDFWYLTVSIARRLLQGENRLPAPDAYWLGAIDEITGDKEAYGLRMLREREPKEKTPKKNTGSHQS